MVRKHINTAFSSRHKKVYFMSPFPQAPAISHVRGKLFIHGCHSSSEKCCCISACCVTKIHHCTVELTYLCAYLPFVSDCSLSVALTTNSCTCALLNISIFYQRPDSLIPLFRVIFIEPHFLLLPAYCCIHFVLAWMVHLLSCNPGLSLPHMLPACCSLWFNAAMIVLFVLHFLYLTPTKSTVHKRQQMRVADYLD